MAKNHNKRPYSKNGKKTPEREDKATNTRARTARSRRNVTNDKDERDVDFKGKDRKSCNWQESEPNDWRWYALNPQLLRDSASIPYSWPVGHQLEQFNNATLRETSIPGIMSIYTSPAYGGASDETDAINIAMRNIFSFVRHANSGMSNYEAPDMFMYLMAMDQCYSYWSFMCRIYGVMRTYSTENKYFPTALLNSMGVDYKDIAMNLNNFRSYINQFAVRIGSFCVPASLSVIAKHMWMYSGLYLDSTTAKAQVYLFNPASFHKLGKITAEEPATHLVNAPFDDNSGLKSFSALVKYGDELLNPIIVNQDFNIMSGDILKAFGENNLFKINLLPEDYVVTPSYDESVLDQIQNSVMIGYTSQSLNEKVLDQDKSIGGGYLKQLISYHIPEYKARFSDAKLTVPGLDILQDSKIVTMPYTEIKPEQTMEATRLCNIVTQVIGSGANAKWTTDTCGTEVANFARVFYYNVASDGSWALLNTDRIYYPLPIWLEFTPGTGDLSEIREAISKFYIMIGKISQFRRHPMFVPGGLVRDVDETGASNYINETSFLYEVDNYAIVDAPTLRNMSDAALISEYSVRQFGKADDTIVMR